MHEEVVEMKFMILSPLILLGSEMSSEGATDDNINFLILYPSPNSSHISDEVKYLHSTCSCGIDSQSHSPVHCVQSLESLESGSLSQSSHFLWFRE